MVFKLKTSKETMLIFEQLNSAVHLQPFALCKIAIALSLRESHNSIKFDNDDEGLELNRQTITGEYDELFKTLIIQNAEQPIDDESYFPKYLKAHIDRGAKMLLSEYKYSNNNLYQHLVEIDKGI